MKICIIPNENKDINKENTKKAEKIMDELNIEYYETPLNSSNENYKYTDPTTFEENTDIVMIFGGDGTIIDAATDLINTNLPIVGVNIGTLGFLAEIEMNSIREDLIKLKDKVYSVQNRMMLDIKINNHKYIALNDLAIRHTGTNNMIDVELKVSDNKVTNYYGDGVVVSTPTGSTAYNLSAGGPIIKPDAKLIVVTPICSHNLGLRSIILNENDMLEFKIKKDKNNSTNIAELLIDGKIKTNLNENDIIKVQKSYFFTKLIKLNNDSFFEILNNKLRG